MARGYYPFDEISPLLVYGHLTEIMPDQYPSQLPLELDPVRCPNLGYLTGISKVSFGSCRLIHIRCPKDHSQRAVAAVRDGHPARYRERDREQELGIVLLQADQGCVQ